MHAVTLGQQQGNQYIVFEGYFRTRLPLNVSYAQPHRAVRNILRQQPSPKILYRVEMQNLAQVME